MADSDSGDSSFRTGLRNDQSFSGIPHSAFRTPHSKWQWAVFVVRGEQVELTPVEVGRRTGLAAQILSGISEGERVVVHPSDQVADEAEVAVR